MGSGRINKAQIVNSLLGGTISGRTRFARRAPRPRHHKLAAQAGEAFLEIGNQVERILETDMNSQ